MRQTLRKTLVCTCASVVFGAMLTFAGGVMMQGRVTAIDEKSMATVLAEDGKEYKVKGEGWKVGTLVECDLKKELIACTAASNAPKMSGAQARGLALELCRAVWGTDDSAASRGAGAGGGVDRLPALCAVSAPWDGRRECSAGPGPADGAHGHRAGRSSGST